MIIDTFLYNDLRYTINLGRKPLLVGDDIIDNYTSVPYIEWEVNFGLMDGEFKNYIEKLLIEENSFGLKTRIHPYFQLIYNEDADLLSYIYANEIKFYGLNKMDITRTLDHTFADPNIIYEGNSYNKIVTIGLQNEITITHKVVFLNESIKVIHKTNGLFQVSAKFKEFFSPTDKTYTTLGVANVNNPGVS